MSTERWVECLRIAVCPQATHKDKKWHPTAAPHEGSVPMAMGKRWAVPPPLGVYPNLPKTPVL